MPISFSCPRCGKSLKAPDNAAGKSSKCPGCGSPVTCPEPVYDAELVDPGSGGADPYADLDSDKPYGLAGGPAPGASPEPAVPGEARRPCPMCGEMIVATAAKCRYCGEIFDPALKKARAKGKKHSADDADLSGGDVAVGLLCGWIGCIAGIVWMIQGKPKGWKMLLLSFISGIVSWVIYYNMMEPHQGALPR